MFAAVVGAEVDSQLSSGPNSRFPQFDLCLNSAGRNLPTCMLKVADC